MANSDNVLRGGLTPKYIDVPELFTILSFEPFRPKIIQAAETSPACYRYTAESETPPAEFTLYRLEGPKAECGEKGAAIVTAVKGRAALSCAGPALVLSQGESAFIGRRKDGEILKAEGDAILFAAISP
jgi:mannose-6-phosphate isomerase